jgi:hypothetical protein
MAITLSGITLNGRVNGKRGSVEVYTTWDTSWTSMASFSNGGLTAATNGNGVVRSLISGGSTGLKYAELTVNSWGAYRPIVGLLKASVTTPGTWAYPQDFFAWWGGGGAYPSQYYGVPGTGNYGDTMNGGDKIGILVDYGTRNVTFYRNGVSQGVATPTLPAGEWAILAMSSSGGNSLNVTANFGATPFTYPVPGATGYYTLV